MDIKRQMWYSKGDNNKCKAVWREMTIYFTRTHRDETFLRPVFPLHLCKILLALKSRYGLENMFFEVETKASLQLVFLNIDLD